MDILLSFVGYNDPHPKDSDSDGPVLSLLSLRNFGRVILFDTPGTAAKGELTHRTAEAIRARFPSTEVDVLSTIIDDPTDYALILASLRPHLSKLLESTDLDADHFFVGIASGTPQMQTCWFLLIASNELPAVLLQMHRPEHGGQYTEIDVRKPEFPVIHRHIGPFTTENEDIDKALGAVKIIGRSAALMTAVDRTLRFSRAGLPIVLLGEPGTGKELFARLAHRFSDRNTRPLVCMNCAAIPETLAESELFGSKKGSFTGADRDRAGKFQQADKGILFLDEVGDLPLPIQAKILRTLQEGTIEPVGGGAETVDVRIIVATNKDLRGMVRDNTFRQDLFDRLAGGIVRLPALRERKRDIELLAHHFLTTSSKVKVLSPSAIVKLQQYPWPGNVRELWNTVQRAVALSEHEEISQDDIEFESDAKVDSVIPEPQEGFDMNAHLDDVRSTLIDRAMEISMGNQAKAARLLGISPQALSKALLTKRV